MLEIRIKGGFFKKVTFYRLLHCCPIENVWEIWLIRIDFGQPNAEIDRNWPMTDLFLVMACMLNDGLIYI